MSKKSVMGHNPLGYRPLADAKLDFIPQTEGGSEGKKSESTQKKSKKKVVSYYLEEDLIQKVKQKAKENENSYSGYVSGVLKKAVND